MTKPIFVDLGGCTARIDPQRGPTSFFRLAIYTEQATDDAGNITHRGQVAEVWIKPDQADELAEALRSARTEP